MSDLNDILIQNRPKLAKSSIRTYSSIIKGLSKATDIPVEKDAFVKNREKIMDYLKDFEPKKRKTILASIIVFIDDGKNDEYVDMFREKMMKDVKDSEDLDKKQQLTEKQERNWMSWNEVEKIYNDLKAEVKGFWKLENLKPSAKSRLQDFVILSVLTLIPPRRSLDWSDFKIRNIDDEKDNYMLKDKLVFNSYKTKRYYGRQTIDIKGNPLKKILNEWIKIQDGDYLFTDTKGAYLSPSKLTQRLYNIFEDKGKKISTSMLRHIFVSDKVLPNVPKLEEMQDTAEKMAHDVSMQLKYKKFPDANSK